MAGLFDQDFVDQYNQYKGLTPEELDRLFPMQPMGGPAVSETPPVVGVMPPGQGGPFDAGGMYTPPAMGPGAPTPPQPAPENPDINGAQMQAPPELLQKLAAARAAQDSQDSAGGEGSGGLLGNRPWGPMLMALGGGIAGGVNQGWGAGIGQGFQNAALIRQRQSALDQEEKLARDKMAMAERLANQKAGPAPTDDMREYAAAKEQGYTGSLMDFIQSSRKAGATNITVGGENAKFGPISADHYMTMDENDQPVMKVVPGSATDKKNKAEAEAAEKRSDVATTGTAEKSDIMLGAIEGIKNAEKGSFLPTTGTLSKLPAYYSETGAAEVRGHVKTLQSGVAIGALQRIRDASTSGASGFGALQEKELELLLNDVGTLDPDGNQEVFHKTVNGIEARYKRVIDDIKKNVPREKLKELGVEEFIYGGTPGGGESGNVGGGSALEDAIAAEKKRRGL